MYHLYAERSVELLLCVTCVQLCELVMIEREEVCVDGVVQVSEAFAVLGRDGNLHMHEYMNSFQ